MLEGKVVLGRDGVTPRARWATDTGRWTGRLSMRVSRCPCTTWRGHGASITQTGHKMITRTAVPGITVPLRHSTSDYTSWLMARKKKEVKRIPREKKHVRKCRYRS
ncbi:hypothetical protein E2C01_072939 [Portunus trituberculatus]|uniref:Uncharacterized protein n=1 Tax=Portunus trituberculatus TaxID=210409 RepID=A0A5B7I820_PORTR|nr:hypothetical protein [Portunus trituberculatus]